MPRLRERGGFPTPEASRARYRHTVRSDRDQTKSASISRRRPIASSPRRAGVASPCWRGFSHTRKTNLSRAPLALLLMRRADVRELLENVGVRLEAIGGNFALGEEGEPVIDHIVGKNAAVGVLRGLGRIEAQHIGQDPILIDRGDCFFAGVIASMPHQVDELIEPALAIVNRLAGVVFLFGLVGVEEAADTRVAGAIDMEELAVAPYAASSPDADLRLGAKLARRQLDHRREHIGFSI